jgi:hypothetical protein
MEEHRNATFHSETIHIAGNVYESCTFVNCVLIYDASDAHIFESNHLERCRLEFEGAAAETLRFVQAMTDRSDEMADLIINMIKGLVITSAEDRDD